MCKALILLSAFLVILFLADVLFNRNAETDLDGWDQLVARQSQKIISKKEIAVSRARDRNIACHFTSYECFDVFRCGGNNGKLRVYIYPPEEIIVEDHGPVLDQSQEMYDILETVYNSDYYTSNPQEACIFLPSVDLLNIKNVDKQLVSAVLNSLPHWNSGRNHLILNIIGNNKRLPTDLAIVATPAHNNQRLGFDLTIPVLSQNKLTTTETETKPYLLSYQHHCDTKYANILSRYSKNMVVQVPGHLSQYKKILPLATFCLVTLPAVPVTLLTDCLAAGSIPVILSPSPPSLPFSQLIDWTEISVQIRPSTMTTLVPLLQSYTPQFINRLQSNIKKAFSQHMSSPGNMILSLLSILERTQRVFNHQVSYPTLRPPNTGFTAVILTYDRIQSLFQVITRVSQVESLMRVVVIWNHQTIPPPAADKWPKISKPLKVIQTSANKLSNRFYPYNEIETECVLSIDDDISMLTVDELEFAYQVWREFPDRIVGFPSRTHVYDNVSDHYKYESEWTNDISLVLTGVAFYHKYWHYLFTAAPSQEQKVIKDWVDDHINCEDIAFNLMVANATGHPPIKVGPRKKFKCSTPACLNSGMLSASAKHLEERSSCLDKFVKIYGHNPLKSVFFRADPVLYKENFPIQLYKDIGSM